MAKRFHWRIYFLYRLIVMRVKCNFFIQVKIGRRLFVDSHDLCLLRTWNCSEDQTEQFQVCNTHKTRESTNSPMPYFGLDNKITFHSHRYQPLSNMNIYSVFIFRNSKAFTIHIPFLKKRKKVKRNFGIRRRIRWTV